MVSKINEALIQLFNRVRNEDGQALAEYGLIIGLIAVVAIAALTALGLALTGQLSSVTGAFTGGS